MRHCNLSDAEAAAAGEHGDVAMQLTVDGDLVDHLAPVRLETAVEVVQIDPEPAPGSPS